MKHEHMWLIIGAVVLFLWWNGSLAAYGFPSSPVAPAKV